MATLKDFGETPVPLAGGTRTAPVVSYRGNDITDIRGVVNARAGRDAVAKVIGALPLSESVSSIGNRVVEDRGPINSKKYTMQGTSKVERVSPKVSGPTKLRDTVPRLTMADNVGKAKDNRFGTKVKNAVNKVGSSIRPEYLSNVANELTGPTGPRNPQLMGTTPSIPKVNMDATRAAITASESAIGRSADQSVDANTGNAIRLGARAQTLTALNTTAEQEARANVGVAQANQQSDTQRRYVDTMTINKYQDDLQEFGNARKSQRLANLSNFADKVVSRENLDRTEALDKEKFAVMKSMFTPGVSDRAYTAAQEALKGINTKSKFRKGGKLKMYAI